MYFSNPTVEILYNRFKPILEHRFFHIQPNDDAKALALADRFVIDIFALYLRRALQLDEERRAAKILAMNGMKPKIPFFLNNQDRDIYDLENRFLNFSLSQRDADTLRNEADNIIFARLKIVFRNVENELKEAFRQQILISSVMRTRREQMESMIGRAGFTPFLCVNIHKEHGTIREELYKRK